MTPTERRRRRERVRQLAREVQPDVVRLVRQLQATMGEPVDEDARADFDMLHAAMVAIGVGLERIRDGRKD